MVVHTAKMRSLKNVLWRGCTACTSVGSDGGDVDGLPLLLQRRKQHVIAKAKTAAAAMNAVVVDSAVAATADCDAKNVIFIATATATAIAIARMEMIARATAIRAVEPDPVSVCCKNSVNAVSAATAAAAVSSSIC